MNESIYKFIRQDGGTAFGDTHRFIGPNLSMFGSEIHLLQPSNKWANEHFTKEYADNDAQKIVFLLNSAYEAGRESMRQDLKRLLGINQHI